MRRKSGIVLWDWERNGAGRSPEQTRLACFFPFKLGNNGKIERTALAAHASSPMTRVIQPSGHYELIRKVREVFPTRNIKHALSTRAFVPFDRFISSSERDAFFQSEVIDEDTDKWQDLPLLTQKQSGRFEKLRTLPETDSILEGLVLFVWCVLPRPRLLENRFWSVTLFPAPHILRVNAGQQEIFTISRGTDGNLLARALTLRALGPDPDGPRYETNSYVDWLRLEDLTAWLTDPERLRASRELAIQLMRHTTALNNGSHCPQVVRAAWNWHEINP